MVYPKPNWVQMWSLKACDILGAKKYGYTMESRSFAMCKFTIDPCMRSMVEDYLCHLRFVYNRLIKSGVKQPRLMDRW